MAESLAIKQLKENLQQLFLSDDVEIREMQWKGKQATLIYLKTTCKSEVIKQFVVKPFWETESELEYIYYLRSFLECEEVTDLSLITEKLLQGFAGIFFAEHIFLLEAKNIESSPVEKTNVETTVNGPQDGYTENLLVNLNLVRRRYRTERLRVEVQEVGSASKTIVAVVYDEDKVLRGALDQLKQRLSEIQVDILQGAGQLEKLLKKQQFSLVPTTLITERPDRTVKNINSGKIAIMMDGAPFVLIAPAIFSDFLASMDDEYQLEAVGKFLLLLRYIALGLTIMLAPIYVATISFNPEFFRVQLAFSIAASRSAVPYPSFVEVLFMLLMMEFLTEASIRLPKSVGPTATTVGGLILGQAASQAGLVSQIMIILVAATAIANFVLPISTLSMAIRLIKYPLILVASFLGMVGVVVGLALFIAYLCSLDSFGTPFVKLLRKVDFK